MLLRHLPLLFLLAGPPALAADAGPDPAAQHAAGIDAMDAGDHARARRLFAPAAAAGQRDSLRELGLLYLYGRGGPAAPALGMSLLEQAAAMDDDDAMWHIAKAHELGEAVPQDLPKARAWYRRSADLGDDDARVSLGQLLEDGEGGARDMPEALRLYRLAARGGQQDAIRALARAYENGDGVDQNHTEAARWLDKGIALGDARAMHQRAWNLLMGVGTASDHPRALRLFGQAADAGSVDALYWLGICHEYGHGTARDHARAIALLRQADAAGHRSAMARAVALTLLGPAGTPAFAEAHAWVERQLAQANLEPVLSVAELLIAHDAVEQGEALLEKAMAVPAPASRTDDFLKSLQRLGATLREKLQFARAEKWLGIHLALLEKNPATAPAVLADGLEELADLYAQSDQPRKAYPLHERALRLRLRAFGDGSAEVADSYASLSNISVALDRYDDAERYARLRHAIAERVFGVTHDKTENSRGALAQLLYAMGRYREAEPLFVRVLTARETRLGEHHPALIGPLNNAAFNHMELGHFDLAGQAFRRALEIKRRRDGDLPDAEMASRQANLGELLTRAGRPGEAEPLLLQSLALRERLLGARHYDVAMSLIRLGKLYLATDRPAQADEALARARAILEASEGAERWEIAGIVHQQGLSQRLQGHLPQARALLAQAFASRLAIQPRHPATRDSAAALAGLERASGDEAAALATERRLNDPG